MKHLYRSKKNQVASGLLAGLGEYFSVDPTFVRLVFVTGLILTGIFPGVLLYILGIFIVPVQPDVEILRETDTHD